MMPEPEDEVTSHCEGEYILTGMMAPGSVQYHPQLDYPAWPTDTPFFSPVHVHFPAFQGCDPNNQLLHVLLAGDASMRAGLVSQKSQPLVQDVVADNGVEIRLFAAKIQNPHEVYVTDETMSQEHNDRLQSFLVEEFANLEVLVHAKRLQCFRCDMYGFHVGQSVFWNRKDENYG